MPSPLDDLAGVLNELDIRGLAPHQIRHLVTLAAGRHGLDFRQIIRIIDELERRTGLLIHDYDAVRKKIAMRHKPHRPKRSAGSDGAS